MPPTDRPHVTISAAALRLYWRAVEIENAIEDTFTADLSNSELLVHLDNYDPEADRVRVKAVLAHHPEYQRVKVELGRVLGLGPDDVHPFDLYDKIDHDRSCDPDDPRERSLWRACELDRCLHEAVIDGITGRRDLKPVRS